jgi:3-hydroxyisobutyrate dehydrogenase-like beta-hydroxyacid dehydrogenase
VKSVALIGTGLMGKPMAMNVLKKGFPLTVYNRTANKTAELAAAGAKVARNAREAAHSADVVITMLSNIEAVESTLTGKDGILEAMTAGKIYIDMSTITPEASRRFARLVEDAGAQMLDAPVSGSTNVAEKGELTIIVGGDPRVLDEVREVLQAMGKFIFHVGDHGSALALKLVINHFVAGMTALLAEGLDLSQKLGIDASVFTNVMNTSVVKSPMYDIKTPKMVSGDYTAQFPLKLLVKDLNYITQTAGTVGAEMPVQSLVRDLFSAANDKGYGEDDFSVIYRIVGKK